MVHSGATAREQALDGIGLPEHAPEAQLRGLSRVAAAVAGMPTAVVNLLDSALQHQVGATGFEGGPSPVSDSMCALALREPHLRSVADASQEPAFAHNPWVDGRLARVRGYASAPLVLPDGTEIGSLCVFDEVPRALTEVQRDALRDLATQVVAVLLAAHREREAVRSGALTAAVLDTMDVGVVACDAAGTLTLFNEAARALHGGAGADPGLAPQQWAERYGLMAEDGVTALRPDQVPLHRALVEGWVSGEMMVIATEGSPARTVVCDGRAMRDQDGALLGALVTMKDVTALRRSEQRFRAAFHAGPTPLARLADDGTVLEANPALQRLLGLGALEGEPLEAHVGAEGREVLRRALSGTGAEPVEVRLLDAAGTSVWCQVGATRVVEPDGVSTVLVQLLDVSARREAQAALEQEARTDALTGLPNRGVLSAHLAAQRAGAVALLFVDLDGFKAVNDVHGHEAGDAVLVEVGRRLREAVRADDLVVRLGGDEFVVVTGAHGPGAVDLLVHRLEAALDAPFSWRGQELGCRASVGAHLGAPGEDPRALLSAADAAMYARKAARAADPLSRRRRTPGAPGRPAASAARPA